MKQRYRNSRAFTLIEMMIVVAIIAILAAIAYPSYTQYVIRSYRAEARNALLETAQWMERNYTLTQNYSLRADNIAQPVNTAHLATINRSVSPSQGTVRYNMSFVGAVTAQAFTLQAVPTAAQNDPRCGTLTINQAQNRTASGTGGAAECWSR
ncbi:MAG: type IV pilin protein [Burkholderiaceae bacterium]